MSTRSQIRFVDEMQTVQVYRHSDGYPDNVIADLMGLKKYLDKTGTFRGAGYTAAQFIFREKLMLAYQLYGPNSMREEKIQSIKQLINFEENQQMHMLGHAVENPADGIHGDEEYLYIVELERGSSPIDTSSQWNVKVSGHGEFPSRDNTNAFELSRWQFTGTLEEAYEKFCKG